MDLPAESEFVLCIIWHSVIANHWVRREEQLPMIRWVSECLDISHNSSLKHCIAKSFKLGIAKYEQTKNIFPKKFNLIKR